MDALHQHFHANKNQWLLNPHIRACYTAHHDIDDEKKAKRKEYYENLDKYYKQPTPEFCKHDKFAVFLSVDNLNETSVIATKKSIEAAGHPVYLELQTENLKQQAVDLEYGTAYYKEGRGNAALGATVKDPEGNTLMLSTGHLTPPPAHFFFDVERKKSFAYMSVAALVPNLGIDASISTFEPGSCNMCPDEYQSGEIHGVGEGQVGHAISYTSEFTGRHMGVCESTTWSGVIEDSNGVKYTYNNLLRCRLNDGDHGSTGGDSGAGYFYSDEGWVMCGLHVSGSNPSTGAKYTYVSPIKPCLVALQLHEDCLDFR